MIPVYRPPNRVKCVTPETNRTMVSSESLTTRISGPCDLGLRNSSHSSGCGSSDGVGSGSGDSAGAVSRSSSGHGGVHGNIMTGPTSSNLAIPPSNSYSSSGSNCSTGSGFANSTDLTNPSMPNYSLNQGGHLSIQALDGSHAPSSLPPLAPMLHNMMINHSTHGTLNCNPSSRLHYVQDHCGYSDNKVRLIKYLNCFDEFLFITGVLRLNKQTHAIDVIYDMHYAYIV